jgi:hypothetical protein
LRPLLGIILPLAGLLLACRVEELLIPPVEEVPPSLSGVVLEADGEPAVGVKINLLYELVGYPEPSPPLDETTLVDTLRQNFPNYFSQQTSISFGLADEQPIHLMVLSTAGDTLRTLAQGFMPAGEHTRQWDGCDDEGMRLPNGVYGIRLVFHMDVDGPSQEIDGVLSLSWDPAILAESALVLSDDEGRFSIPLSELPVDRMIPAMSVDGVLQGIFPVSSILQVHAGRSEQDWSRLSLDLGDSNEDIAVELQLP